MPESPAPSGTTENKLQHYGELVRNYHATLDLLSPAALEGWQEMLADALAYSELLGEIAPDANTILDVGSGAGLPGIPLAISRPDLEVHLVERRRRRTAFLNLVRGQLNLERVSVHGRDVRDLTGFAPQVITAQAVASLSDIYALTSHLHGETVWLLGRKGPDWPAELAALEAVTGQAAAKVVERPLSSRGTLLGVFHAGGLECRPSE